MAVSESVWGKRAFNAEKFRAKYGQLPAFKLNDSTISSFYYEPSRLCLFFINNQIPVDLIDKLREFVPKPLPVKVATLESLPDHVKLSRQSWRHRESAASENAPLVQHFSEGVAFSELQSVLFLIKSEKISVGAATLIPGKAAVKEMEASFDATDFLADGPVDAKDEDIGPIRSFAWPMLVQGLGFAKAEASGKLKLTKRGLQALESSKPHVAVKDGFSKWLGFSFDELSRIDIIKGQTGKGRRALTKPQYRREALCAALKSVPHGKWLNIDEFARLLRFAFEFHAVNRDERALWSLYISDIQYGSLGYAGDTFQLIEGPYLRFVLMEYFATLGLIDIGYSRPDGIRSDYSNNWGTDCLEYYSRYDGLYAFRVNDFGRYCLGITDSYTLTAKPRRTMLVLSNTGEVSPISGDFSKREEADLDSWSTVTHAGIRRLSLQQGLLSLEAGKSARELRDFLIDRTDCEFPESVEKILKELECQEHSLKYFDSAHMFTVKDRSMRERLLTDSRTGKYCFEVSKELVGVYERDRNKFKKGLNELGLYMPAPH